jgi:hypothetical protein
MKMKFKTSLIVILVCLMITSSAFAADWVKFHQGDWNNAANWSGGLPNGTTETKIRWNAVPQSICNLRTVDDWGTALGGNRLSIYNNATLNIYPGASLTGPGWFRVGKGGDGGNLNQTGGTIILKVGQDTSNLVIGDEGGSNGIYTMSGGILTYDKSDGGDGQLILGDRGGTGTFIVTGTAPIIQMKSFYVGGVATDRGSNGTLQYNITAGGVSTIHCSLYIKLDLGGASHTANLIVNGCPTNTSVPIVLVENTGSDAVYGPGGVGTGKFDHLNGGDANEGASIVLGVNGAPYTLTYKYNAEANGGLGELNTGNDIALIPTLSITIPTPAVNTGDLLIAAVATNGDTSASIAAPADQGWTQIDSGACSGAVTLAAWWKIVGASEPSSHTFAWTGAAEQAYGWMMCFSGQDAANPINVSQSYNDSSNTPTSPAVTTTVSNCLILRLGAFDDNSIVIDSPGLSGHTAITMDESRSIASSGVVSGGAGFVKQPAIGSSGTSTFSLTATKNARTLTIAIAPASTGKNVCCEDEITP